MASSCNSVASPGTGDPQLHSDLQLWYSCAGVPVKIPPVNSQVYYFVQGHAEHAAAAGSNVDLEMIKNTPHRILCRVKAVEYGADDHTDEVYTKIVLKPVNEPIENEYSFVNNAFCKYASRKLTTTDIRTGRCYVTRDCDKMIPLRVNYVSCDIDCKDVHGDSWSFTRVCNHLTNGWSEFATKKGLKVNDTILFMRDTQGSLIVGIQRAGPTEKQHVSDNLVVAAAMLAASGEAFKVYYYPSVGTPEFVVSAAIVQAAIAQIPRLRINTTIDFEDSLTHERRRGTVLSVQAVDPERWPDSSWKRLQVSVLELAPSVTQNLWISAWTVNNIQVPEDSQKPPCHESQPTKTTTTTQM